VRPDASVLDPSAFVDHPSGFLALSERNHRFWAPGVPGFVAYRRHGRYRLCFGGVQAPPACRTALLDAFLAESRGAGHRVVAVQVRQDQADLFRARGFVVNQLGTSFGLDLAGFTLRGARRLKLRNRIKRASGAGVSAVELGRDRPLTAAAWQDLQRVSRAWLSGKKAPELDFMIGELGRPGDPRRRVFAALDAQERVLGFITYVPAWGARPGYLHDLTRRLRAAPPGIMELLNAFAAERFAAEGARFLHFGFTPFIVDPVEPSGGHRGLAWLVRLIGRRGRLVYPARSQHDYKMKWAPDVLEREHLALERVSAGALWALLVVTRSVPWPPRLGGSRGLSRPEEAFP
jgi:lysylphosphatidylglycerol synthetase-like protein (DUF2156 family)